MATNDSTNKRKQKLRVKNASSKDYLFLSVKRHAAKNSLKPVLRLMEPLAFSVTVKDVCQEAKLTERYFYESFKKSEDLFQTIFLK